MGGNSLLFSHSYSSILHYLINPIKTHFLNSPQILQPTLNMRFSTITASALFAAFAAASNETVIVENLSIRDNDGIVGASMTLQPANVSCASSDAAALAGFGTVLCGETAYRFAVNGTDSDYNIRIYKELGPA